MNLLLVCFFQIDFVFIDPFWEEVFPAVDFTGQPQRFFTISDYAEAYRQNKTTPLEVAKRLLKIIEESNQHQVPIFFFFFQQNVEHRTFFFFLKASFESFLSSA